MEGKVLTEASLALYKPSPSHSLSSSWAKICFPSHRFRACKSSSCAELQVAGAFLLPFITKEAQKNEFP